MARTIPANIKEHGHYTSKCDVCGSMWLRRDLRRGRNGQLRCPDDWAGRDELELAELTAMSAAAVAAAQAAQLPADGASPHLGSDGTPGEPYTGPTRRTTGDDIFNGNEPSYFDSGTLLGLDGF